MKAILSTVAGIAILAVAAIYLATRPRAPQAPQGQPVKRKPMRRCEPEREPIQSCSGCSRPTRRSIGIKPDPETPVVLIPACRLCSGAWAMGIVNQPSAEA